MSITFKIKTNNNRVKQFQQVHKAEKQVIYQVELRNRWKRYVLLRVFTYLVYGNNLLLEYSQYLEDPATVAPNSACSINILMSKHSFLSTIRLFRHLHRSSVYSSLAVWYIPLKETACQTKCSKHCWCWKQCLLVYLMNINCWLLHVLYWLVGSSGHCVLFELSATVAWHWHFHFLPN